MFSYIPAYTYVCSNDNDTAMVSLPAGTYEITIDENIHRFSSEVKTAYEFPLTSMPTLAVVKSIAPTVQYWIHNKTHEHIDVDDVQRVYNLYFDSDEQTYQYPDLETEFEIRSWLKELNDNCSPVFSDRIESIELVNPIKYGHVADTKSQFIKVPFNIVKAAGSNFFEVSCGEIAKDQFDRLRTNTKYANVSFENATHSNIAYLKINDSYVFPTSNRPKWVESLDACVVCGTLEAAQQLEQDIRTYVTRFIHTGAQLCTDLISNKTANQILKGLACVADCVDNIPSTKLNRNHKQLALSTTTKLINIFNQIVDYHEQTGMKQEDV